MIPNGCVRECPACKHREWTTAESLNQKYGYLRNKLNAWIDALEPVISVYEINRWEYRSKTILNARYINGYWNFGMMVKDKLVSIPNCPIHTPNVNQTLNILRKVLPEQTNFPLAFVVQTSAQVVLIVKSKNLADNTWLTKDVKNQFRNIGVEGLWIHCNPSAGRRLFEKTPLTLICGKKKSIDSEGFYYGAGAFQQLIPELYNQSLNAIIDFFKPSQHIAIVDLYCGIGKSVKKWLDLGSSVLGVEQNGTAIDCAKLNVPSALIFRGACRQRIPQIEEWVNQQKANNKRVFFYLNPPRTGVEKEVLDWIVDVGRPEKIGYLSCSAGTLSKNLGFLCSNGYRVIKLIPFDFFPQTIHVECLALLAKVKST